MLHSLPHLSPLSNFGFTENLGKPKAFSSSLLLGPLCWYCWICTHSFRVRQSEIGFWNAYIPKCHHCLDHLWESSTIRNVTNTGAALLCSFMRFDPPFVLDRIFWLLQRAHFVSLLWHMYGKVCGYEICICIYTYVCGANISCCHPFNNNSNCFSHQCFWIYPT